MSQQPLAGKVALVTGGSRGIGAATALRLADDGADVAITYVSSHERAKSVVSRIEQRGVRGKAFASDQADPEQAASLVDQVMAEFGRLDILVNNAGIFVTGSIDAEETDQEAMARQYAVNVAGVVAVTRAAAKVMGEGGRIVSVGSTSGDRTPFPGLGDYSATKAAITAYTRAWARDLGPRGITVNAAQTSSISTDMNPDVGPFADVQRSMNALGRYYGRPEEMAAAIAFLADPDASFVTGATLNVDGGFNA
ncbi:SDR family NAD(P)-dependent oxidoreductase [Nonomuraea aridisoli]|uniref:Oxidoreductase n=1 Tax=Nonomuraea aridisoli TaxID=2070368 RepID=A0A2W2DI19_9ACTN|nr:SDR family oxidoreductase [Nonomuraea aridisoli]PZG10121.1 oxidoreductase [Nonomuraea aridisoli]